MKVLFTGFTARTTGSEQLQYDYMCNVNVLRRALELAGHDVDCRQVSLYNDPCVEEDYDCALVGIAACQGLSSRFKLGALWTLHKFGTRAAIFPSDGKNVYTFPSSVLTCLQGEHYNKITGLNISPVEYFLGDLQQEKNNVVDTVMGHEMQDIWRATLFRLPHSATSPKCDWPTLVPTHAWGDPTVYARHFGGPVSVWDPTNVAIPMQFPTEMLGADGRLNPPYNHPSRKREWILATLQDQDGWLKKQKCKWPVITIGNKRKALKGEGLQYIPELQLIREYYTKYAGTLAFGYPLASGGWWRMRLIHAALAGCVTCCDETDAMHMPEAFRHSRIRLEGRTDEQLAEIAHNQYIQLMDTAWSIDRAVSTVDQFVKGLV